VKEGKCERGGYILVSEYGIILGLNGNNVFFMHAC